jgi:ABC-type transporter Mla MlaB component
MKDELTDHAASRSQQQPSARTARPATPVVLEVGGIGRPDFGTIDALCRVVLEGRRSSCNVRLRGVVPELCELIELAGLGSVLPGRRETAGRAGQRTGPSTAACERISFPASARPGSR